MRVLLIAASGVIGRRALPLLVAQGNQVTAATHPGSKRALPSVGTEVTSMPLDIFDVDAARRLMSGHDAVINLATKLPTGTLKPFLPGAWDETNRIRRDASRILTRAAHEAGVPRFIQESFAPIYEDGGSRWIDETCPVRPSRYNRAMVDAEHAVEQFGSAANRSGVALRFALFYGDHDPNTDTIIQSVRHGWMPFPGRSDGYLSMVHHQDAASAVVAALTVPSGVYNVVDDEPLTRREFGDALAGILAVKPPRLLPEWVAKLTGSVGEMLSRSLRISNRKLRDASGWTPVYPSAREGWRGL